MFADIVNVLLFDGVKVVEPNNLENELTKSQYKADDNVIHEQERDVSKFWKDGSVKIVLYGLENQTLIDNDMPLRVMGYDGQSYRSELTKANGKNRYPVITLVLYFGMKRWTGPRSLYEAIDVPEYLKPHVSDYKINVFEIAYLDEEQVKKFKSDFKQVADYFVQMRTKNDYVPSKETLEHVDAVLKIMSVLTQDTRFEEVQNNGEEVKTMCEALDKVEKKGIQKGIVVLVETLKEVGQSNEFIINKLMQKFGLSETEAKTYL